MCLNIVDDLLQELLRCCENDKTRELITIHLLHSHNFVSASRTLIRVVRVGSCNRHEAVITGDEIVTY